MDAGQDKPRFQAGAGGHRRFMALAIEQAMKSKAEPNRTSPRVGVVIAKNGVLLVAAYRGEVNDGDHAEYTALEKKLADDLIAGATVYTTLEPCTTRNPPKISCVQRLIERRVRRVFVGMVDPDERIRGQGVRALQAAGIEVQLFPKAENAVIEEMNREFTRSRTSVQGKLAIAGPAGADRKQVGPFAVVSRRFEESVPGTYEATVGYPEIAAGMPPDALDELNVCLKSTAVDFLHQLRSAASSPPLEDIHRFEMGYTVTLAREGLFSLVFGAYHEYGGCRPYVLIVTRTYAYPGLRRLGIGDLFSHHDYAPALSELCVGDLLRQGKDDGFYDPEYIRSGAGPKYSNFEQFSLSEDALLIYFDPERVGPPGWGPREIKIPYQRLADVLDTSGPLAFLAAR